MKKKLLLIVTFLAIILNSCGNMRILKSSYYDVDNFLDRKVGEVFMDDLDKFHKYVVNLDINPEKKNEILEKFMHRIEEIYMNIYKMNSNSIATGSIEMSNMVMTNQRFKRYVEESEKTANLMGFSGDVKLFHGMILDKVELEKRQIEARKKNSKSFSDIETIQEFLDKNI